MKLLMKNQGGQTPGRSSDGSAYVIRKSAQTVSPSLQNFKNIFLKNISQFILNGTRSASSPFPPEVQKIISRKLALAAWGTGLCGEGVFPVAEAPRRQFWGRSNSDLGVYRAGSPRHPPSVTPSGRRQRAPGRGSPSCSKEDGRPALGPGLAPLGLSRGVSPDLAPLRPQPNPPTLGSQPVPAPSPPLPADGDVGSTVLGRRPAAGPREKWTGAREVLSGSPRRQPGLPTPPGSAPLWAVRGRDRALKIQPRMEPRPASSGPSTPHQSAQAAVRPSRPLRAPGSSLGEEASPAPSRSLHDQSVHWCLKDLQTHSPRLLDRLCFRPLCPSPSPSPAAPFLSPSLTPSPDTIYWEQNPVEV